MGEQENIKSGGEKNNMVVVEAAPPAASKENGRVVAPDPRLQGISDAIRVVPHFPKPGIMFNDITALLLRPDVFKDAVDMFVERYRGMGIAAVAGIEARGFIFGPAIALAIGAKFIPLRKPKKLPGQVISESYELEYGRDCLEMHVGAIEPGERVVVVDDLVATGGTLSAGIRLLGFIQAQWNASIYTGGVPQIECTKGLIRKARGTIPFQAHGGWVHGSLCSALSNCQDQLLRIRRESEMDEA